MRFTLPDGVQYDGTDEDGNDCFRVPMPLDEQGFFGRECPSCGRTFLVCSDDYEALPDDLRLWCVYCGYREDHSEFLTGQQRARVMSLAEDVGLQIVHQELDQAFGLLRRNARSGSGVSFRPAPSPPRPRRLPGVQEEQLVRERQCATCSLRYAVFGEHRFCPVCGRLPPAQTAADGLDAETSMLDALRGLSPDIRAALREQGVLDRQYIDAVENLVSIVESAADAVFRERVPGAATLIKGKRAATLKGKRNVFQRLDDLADLFRTQLSKDLPAALGPRWTELQHPWAGRHIYAHNDGVIDDRYIQAVPAAASRRGERLTVTEEDARHAIDNARALIDEITRP